MDRGIRSPGEIEEYLTLFTMGDFDDDKHRKHLIKLFLDRVVVYDDKVLVSFNLPMEARELSVDEMIKIDKSNTGVRLDETLVDRQGLEPWTP